MDIVKKLENKSQNKPILWMMKVKIKKYQCMIMDFLV